MSNGEMSEDGSTVTFTVRGTTYATHILESGPTTSLANLLSSAGQSYSAAFVFASLSDRLFDASLTDGGDGLKEAYSLFGAATTSFKCVCLILNEAGFKEKLSSISFAHIQQSAPEVTHVIKKNFLRAASKDYPGGQPGIFVVDLTDPPKVKSVMNGALAVVMEHMRT